MKIVHLCLSCFYIDGYAYQENELVAQNVADGHDVLVIASTETYGSDRRLTYLTPGSYVGTDGARVIRLPYRKFLPQQIMRKLRMHPGLLAILERESPDIILFHGLCGWELLTTAKYKRMHPHVRFYADSHEDFNNSARSFVSRHLLHGAYYKPILQSCLDEMEKILCISMDTVQFVNKLYGVSSDCLEFFPLGGKLWDDAQYLQVRQQVRESNFLGNRDVVFVQSGKMDQSKKLLEALTTFSAIPDQHLHFLIAGHLQEDISAQVHAMIEADPRIRFLGWQAPEELRRFLCAADVYVQPGTQSSTMQMSICCRCAVILDDVPSHEPFVNGNGWLIGPKLTLEDAFRAVAEHLDELPAMSEHSASIAARLLDYRSLAARLYR